MEDVEETGRIVKQNGEGVYQQVQKQQSGEKEQETGGHPLDC